MNRNANLGMKVGDDYLYYQIRNPSTKRTQNMDFHSSFTKSSHSNTLLACFLERTKAIISRNRSQIRNLSSTLSSNTLGEETSLYSRFHQQELHNTYILSFNLFDAVIKRNKALRGYPSILKGLILSIRPRRRLSRSTL